MQQVPHQSYVQAIQSLGNFIYNFPHEDGNPEFVLGRMELVVLGRSLYELQFGDAELTKYLEMMEVEMV